MIGKTVTPDLSTLTDRERQILAMLGRGHDAKSMAATLDLSVHTINERLRTARRKLGASSSREAARMLGPVEHDDPRLPGAEILGHQKLGVTPTAPHQASRTPRFDPPPSAGRAFLYVIGAALMIFVTISAVAFWSSGPVEESTAAPRAAPHVVRTMPAADASIAPGPFTLSVTYDRPMRGGAYSFVQQSADSYPQCEPHPTQSADRRTFAMRCVAVAGRTYHVAFNSEPYMHFQSADGVPAMSHRLTFVTRPR